MATSNTLVSEPQVDEADESVELLRQSAVTASALPSDVEKKKNPIESAMEGLFSLAVGFTAKFMTAVLTHPLVKDAAASVMVAGMNQFMTQEDLGKKLLEMDENMTEYNEEMAKKTGADLPAMASNMWKGFTGNGKEKEGAQTNN